MLAGKDKGKSGKVLQVFVKEKSLVVEGLNLMIKASEPRAAGETGQRIQFPSAVDGSNSYLSLSRMRPSDTIAHKYSQKEGGKNSRTASAKNAVKRYKSSL